MENETECGAIILTENRFVPHSDSFPVNQGKYGTHSFLTEIPTGYIEGQLSGQSRDFIETVITCV